MPYSHRGVEASSEAPEFSKISLPVLMSCNFVYSMLSRTGKTLISVFLARKSPHSFHTESILSYLTMGKKALQNVLELTKFKEQEAIVNA